MNIEQKRERLYKKYEGDLDANLDHSANQRLNQLRKMFDSSEEFHKYLKDRMSFIIDVTPDKNINNA